MLLEDMLVIDAATLYPRYNRGGSLYSLDVIDGATIKPLIGEDGRAPEAPDPAYQQILKGVPAADFSVDELLYLPRNLRAHRLYGMSPVEQITPTINIALRRDAATLDYYSAGSTPDAFATLPKEWTAEGLDCWKWGWDAPCLNRNRKAGLPSAPMARREHPHGETIRCRSARARSLALRRPRDLGTAAGRGDLVRLALRLIVEEALAGEVSDVLGRERHECGEGHKSGYRNRHRPGKVKTAEGAVHHSAPQVRDTPEPFVSAVRAALSGRTRELERLAVELLCARPVDTRHRGRLHRRDGPTASVAGGGERDHRETVAEYEDFCKRDLSRARHRLSVRRRHRRASAAGPAACGRACQLGGLARTDARRCWG